MGFFRKNNQEKQQKLTPFQIVIVVLFFLCFIGLKLWNARWPKEIIELKGQQLEVIVAHTPDHRHKGLGGKESLGKYDGMLFEFPGDGHYTFVMRDTLFAIDIIWFDNGVVIDIASNVPTELDKPESELTLYTPRAKADTVLELPAGWSNAHDLKIGDRFFVVD